MFVSDGVAGRFRLDDYPSLGLDPAPAIAFNVVRRFGKGMDDASCAVMTMPMVRLGTLSVTGAKGITAMRRSCSQLHSCLGVNSIRATRLASAASDHAKDVTRDGALEVGVEVGGSTQGKSSAWIS